MDAREGRQRRNRGERGGGEVKVQGSRFEVQGGRVRAGGRTSLITNHSRGFSLIECLVYISVFALLMTLAMQLFFQTRDSADRLRRNADDLTRALHAGELWREEIRAATASPRRRGARWDAKAICCKTR